MIVKGKGPIPVHAAAAAAAVQAGRQPPVGSPTVLSHSCYLLLFLSCMQHMFCMSSHQQSLACLSWSLCAVLAKSRTGNLVFSAPQPVYEQESDRAFSVVQWSSMAHAEEDPSWQLGRTAMQIRTAQSATLDSIPEVRNGAMRRSQTASRPLPPLREPLLPEPQLVSLLDSERCAGRGALAQNLICGCWPLLQKASPICALSVWAVRTRHGATLRASVALTHVLKQLGKGLKQT